MPSCVCLIDSGLNNGQCFVVFIQDLYKAFDNVDIRNIWKKMLFMLFKDLVLQLY